MHRNDTHDLAEALRDWMAVLMQHSMRGFVAHARDLGLSMTQIGAMMHLHRVGSCAVSEISSDLGVTNAAASQMLDRLVSQGFIVRQEDPADRRVKRVALTERGTSAVGETVEARRRLVDQLARSMSPEDRSKAIEGLKVLTRNLKEMESIQK